MSLKNPGDSVSYTFNFSDQNGNLFDPDNVSCTILDPAGLPATTPSLTHVSTGTYSLTWNIPLTAVPGTWTIQISAVKAGVTEAQSFYFSVTAPAPTPISPNGIYIMLADVQAQLNAGYDSASQAYTVFGLPVSETSFQAHVDFANLYVNSIVGSSLSSTDPRAGWARMAALNLACLRILVAASGGLLLGAFDYRLGDLYITKANVGRLAFQNAVQGFKDDMLKIMMNFSTPVVAAEASMKDEVSTYKGGLMNP